MDSVAGEFVLPYGVFEGMRGGFFLGWLVFLCDDGGKKDLYLVFILILSNSI